MLAHLDQAAHTHTEPFLTITFVAIVVAILAAIALGVVLIKGGE